MCAQSAVMFILLYVIEQKVRALMFILKFHLIFKKRHALWLPCTQNILMCAAHLRPQYYQDASMNSPCNTKAFCDLQCILCGAFQNLFMTSFFNGYFYMVSSDCCHFYEFWVHPYL